MCDLNKVKNDIESGRASLGIELGSTRIKAVLIGSDYSPAATGSYEWENVYDNGIWTYPIEKVWEGLRECYAKLAKDVKEKYGVTLKKLQSLGISAMMHGYLPFDKEGNQLVPFRTWRNTITSEAAAQMTELFQYNIPQRWSSAHYYQAMLNGEEHVKDVDFFTTLSGYVHWKLTGRKVLGIGDAAGMFPVSCVTHDYREDFLQKFDALATEKGFPKKLKDLMPEVLVAGQDAGTLTEEGARLLDPTGELEAGIPMCAPEGDAGTGMAATNSVAVRTGNVSAGTSIFAMIVLEKDLEKLHTEIDMVTTPAGDLVAMAHANNCTSDLNAWVGLFEEFAGAFGMNIDKTELFTVLYNKALEGDPDCGGLLSYGYLSGENVIEGLDEGRPLFARTPDSRFTLANFMRSHLFASLGAMKMGMDILTKEEKVGIDKVLGHGGLFKTKGVGQKLMAAALDTPVSVMSTAGEGGAWGIALLAAYLTQKEEGESLDQFLDKKVFSGYEAEEVRPDPEDVRGFEAYMERFVPGLHIERTAVEYLK